MLLFHKPAFKSYSISMKMQVSVFLEHKTAKWNLYIYVCTFLLAWTWWLKLFYNKINPVSPTGDFSGQWDGWDIDETHSKFLAYKLCNTKEFYSIFEISLTGNIFKKWTQKTQKLSLPPFRGKRMKILGMRKPVNCSPVCLSKLMGTGIRPCCQAPVSSSSALRDKAIWCASASSLDSKLLSTPPRE